LGKYVINITQCVCKNCHPKPNTVYSTVFSNLLCLLCQTV